VDCCANRGFGGDLAGARVPVVARGPVSRDRITRVPPRFLILRHVPFFVAGIAFYRITMKGLTPRVPPSSCGSRRRRVDRRTVGREVPAVGWIDGSSAWASRCPVRDFGLAVTGKLRFAVSPVTLWLGASRTRSISPPQPRLLDDVSPARVRVPVWSSSRDSRRALVLATALSHLVERPALRALRQWVPDACGGGRPLIRRAAAARSSSPDHRIDHPEVPVVGVVQRTPAQHPGCVRSSSRKDARGWHFHGMH